VSLELPGGGYSARTLAAITDYLSGTSPGSLHDANGAGTAPKTYFSGGLVPQARHRALGIGRGRNRPEKAVQSSD